MGKPSNSIVDESFIQVINDGFKGVRVVCKYCSKELDKNTSGLQNQLNSCRIHQEARTSGQALAVLHASIA